MVLVVGLCYSLAGDDFNIGMIMPILGLLFFGAIFFIATVILDIKKFRSSKKYLNFIPTLTGLLATFTGAIVVNKLNAPNNSPVIIHAGLSGGGRYTWLTLHSDNSYEYFNGSALGGTTTKGNYVMHDSIITLDKEKIDNALISNSLLISLINHGSTTICQLDKSGHEINGSMFLTVSVYNRHK